MKKSCLLFAGLISACISALSCRKAEVLQVQEKIPINGRKMANANIVTHSRNVNVVYFVPNDLDTITGYRKRLSDLLLWTQNWYKQEMNRNGYGNKTFGLADDGSGGVKILTIRGSLPKSSYPYEGGADAVEGEVNAYFAAHPADKTSNHTLVIIPRYKIQSDGGVTGGPFYGIGRWCYALDYEEMDVANIGSDRSESSGFSGWFGGMVHELGHGLNLDHNRQKVSENSTLGTTLMGTGNKTLSLSPTFLSAADAAILNVNEVFNDNSKTYYGPVTSNISKIYSSYDSSLESIVVSGKFTSTGNVSRILYYNDPNTDSEDYDAVTWESKKIGTDSFSVAMPIADLEEKADGTLYELKVKLVHDNGIVNEQVYTYTFSNGLPVLSFSTKNEISKTGWSIASFSSQESIGEAAPNGKAIRLIDGNAGTYWHSQWSSPATNYPHYIVINLGSLTTARGLSLTQRNGLHRAIKNFEMLTSTDGANFSSVNKYVASNLTGAQYFDFASPKTFQYFKIIARSAHDGLQFASLAELGLY